ncbi:MAG: helix-turn-helix transcriptional regulator [Lachnospiraceae bacterium]|nr:helix-turn-helix transcriptional regulator [Lachnospiraceae bacterium]
MLSDNIKNLRKSRGYTQEELAIRVNVVRQTISKWEKGLSVPDAESLQRVAEVLDVDVKQLLGIEVDVEKNHGEVVEQLARINEQLIIKNKRAYLIWKIIGIVLVCFILFNLFLMVLSYAAFETVTNVESMEVIVEEVDTNIEN